MQHKRLQGLGTKKSDTVKLKGMIYWTDVTSGVFWKWKMWGRWKCRTRKCKTWKWRTKLQGWKMQDLKMQDRLWIQRTVDVRYNEQTRNALLCHVCRHCCVCVHGEWLPDMQKPNTHGAASVPIKFRLTIYNLTSNVILCAILWTDVYTQTVADCFVTTYNRINFATSILRW